MAYDFIIIGGGIAGVSMAARLAPHARVLLLEQEDALAHHASGRSAALYEPHYGAPPLVELALASGDFLHAGEGILRPRGMMLLGGPDQRAGFERDAEALHLSPMSLAEARAIVPVINPETVAHVAVADHAWDIDTDLLLQGFLRKARDNGAEVLTRQPVQALTREAAGWRVVTAQGSFAGAAVVNAAGAWADVVAGMAGVSPLGLVPFRRSMARIPAPGGHDTSGWPTMLGVDEAWYAKPDAGALIVSPSEEERSVPHDAFADDMVLAEGLARYQERMTEPVTRMLANWAGLRTFAPDRLPVVGYEAGAPGFFWLAGQGGYGFQTSPALSQLAADQALGHVGAYDELARALSPGRFR